MSRFQDDALSWEESCSECSTVESLFPHILRAAECWQMVDPATIPVKPFPRRRVIEFPNGKQAETPGRIF